METSALLLFVSSFLFFTYTALSQANCPPSSCFLHVQKVRFPFRLIDRQDARCGYPGFDLYCDYDQIFLKLPHDNDFIVDDIDYINQLIHLKDPNSCMANRILNLNLSGSPFENAYLNEFTFFNCSKPPNGFLPLYCLSTSPNYTVVVGPAGTSFGPPAAQCHNMSAVAAAVSFPALDWTYDTTAVPGPSQDLQLVWKEPTCGRCEYLGQTCGFAGDTGLDIQCFDQPSHGLPRSSKIGLTAGVGIPGLLFGIACYMYCSRKTQRRRADAQLSTPAATQLPATGLNGTTIESYPKTEFRENTKPNDSTCPICLAEYQPKDTLRTIPECNHYFHATCVDEWLRMKATCPLCRKMPA